MPTTTFDPMADPFLEDPYPQFRRFVESQPVFWSAELGYWGASASRRRAAGVARARDLLGLERSRTAPAVPRGGSSTGRRRLRVRSDPHERRSARPHSDSAHCPPRLHAAAGGADGGLRARSWSAASSPSDFTRDEPRSCRRSPGSCRARGVPRPRRTGGRRGGGEARLGQPSAVHVRQGWRGRAGRHRNRYGASALLRGAGRGSTGDAEPGLRPPTWCTPPTPPGAASQQEVATILFGLLLAGHETTTNLLGNSLRRLLEHRDSWEAICADPSSIPGAVEETLRFDSSVIHWRRRTTKAVELSGIEVPAEANVLVSIGAANRDPAVFPDPDRFDIRRPNAPTTCRSGRVRTSASALRSPGSRLGSCSRS